MIVDTNIEDVDIIEFIQDLREDNKKLRILFLTDSTDSDLLINAIELDITRYLVKDKTNENDMIVALKKCLKELEVSPIVNLGDGYVYSKRLSCVITNNEKVPLRKKELELLDFFIEHTGELLSYETLENELWQDDFMTRDAIRSQMRNLRKKIQCNCFENITGVGYKFSVK